MPLLPVPCSIDHACGPALRAAPVLSGLPRRRCPIRRQTWLWGLLIGLGLHTTAQADETLARQRQCLGCHQIERKVVGPALRDVARKYAGQDVALRLAQKIRSGGAGAWGVVPMPANRAVSEAESLQLARWVLSLR